jgi:plastocyanin
MKIKKHVALFTLLVSLFMSPHFVVAKIVITEIMYDPSGTDTGREWIEIYNDGSGPVDMATLRFFENNVAHTMKAHNAPAALLLADTYAIVADNPEKFLIDYPTYAGLLIDSAFSLNNTGEPLSIQTVDAIVDSTVTYSVEWGAAGNGNSLQLSDSIWIPALPTIAVANATIPADESGEETETTDTTSATNSTSTESGGGTSTTNTTSTHNSHIPVSTYKPKVKFEVTAGRDRYGFVNTPLIFVPAHNQESGSGMRFLWSSGDGDFSKGKTFEHTYKYPGEYNLVLNASYQGMQSVSRNKVFIRTPDITANIINRGKLVDIMLMNGGEFEVNVGGYEVQVSDRGKMQRFEIPQDTIISGRKDVIIPSEINGIEMDNTPDSLKIIYPSGATLFELIYSDITQQQN